MDTTGSEESVLHFPNGSAGYECARRIRDVVISVLGLVILLPVLVIVALIVFLEEPQVSPIYSQTRVGLGGRRFTLYKFRTMYPDADREKHLLLSRNEMEGPVFKIRNDPRVTPVGRFLRKSCLDELPQLWNVIIGDMSLVGPRPDLPEEIARYDELARMRLGVLPGITCLWQIREDRYELAFRDWVALDLRYIRERNLCLDLQILLATIVEVAHMNGR